MWFQEGCVTGGWRKLQNDELNNGYSSSNIIRLIKSRTDGQDMQHACHTMLGGCGPD
jgi:hypothetical protein